MKFILFLIFVVSIAFSIIPAAVNTSDCLEFREDCFASACESAGGNLTNPALSCSGNANYSAGAFTSMSKECDSYYQSCMQEGEVGMLKKSNSCSAAFALLSVLLIASTRGS